MITSFISTFLPERFPEQVFQCIQVCVGIQDDGVVDRFISQEDTNGAKMAGT